MHKAAESSSKKAIQNENEEEEGEWRRRINSTQRRCRSRVDAGSSTERSGSLQVAVERELDAASDRLRHRFIGIGLPRDDRCLSVWSGSWVGGVRGREGAEREGGGDRDGNWPRFCLKPILNWANVSSRT